MVAIYAEGRPIRGRMLSVRCELWILPQNGSRVEIQRKIGEIDPSQSPRLMNDMQAWYPMACRVLACTELHRILHLAQGVGEYQVNGGRGKKGYESRDPGVVGREGRQRRPDVNNNTFTYVFYREIVGERLGRIDIHFHTVAHSVLHHRRRIAEGRPYGQKPTTGDT